MHHNSWHTDESEEAEDAMAWLQGIGGGAAAGAATGAAAGPWGALVGGVVGAGLGALSTHQQQQQQQQQRNRPRPSSPTRRPPRSPSRPSTAPPTARPPAPGPRPAPATAPSSAGPDVLDELRRLLPALRSLAAAALASPEPNVPVGEPVQGSAPVGESSGRSSVFGPPVPAWEAAESVERALLETDDDTGEAAVGHVHPEPHPAARAAAASGHPLHDLHRAISTIARGGA